MDGCRFDTGHQDVTERRRFNLGERTVLYLAADGRCSECGAELEPGWHADHVQPWSRDGKTDVINGQALCPACNLRKGNRMTELRQWQSRAMDEYLASGQQDFLLEATPGAGKTRLAMAIARRLLDDGTVKHVAVVVPTDPLRLQWCDAGSDIRLRPLDDAIVSKAGYDGVVLTYAQLARGVSRDLLRRDVALHPALLIADEIHHAGSERPYSQGLESAFEHAPRRLLLTGTPWRRDNRKIPYVRYDDDGNLHVDYHYRYGRAVNDRICRPIVFHAHNGEARWVDCGVIVEAHVCEDLDEDKTGAALDTIYRPEHQWMPAMLRKAAAALDAQRADGVPDAGGLVWAETRKLAEAYAALLHGITGQAPVLVLGDDPSAKAKIDAFRASSQRWIVSVRMISEGIDIPRLTIGVYAAKKWTPLFFRQAVGRLIRTRGDESHNAQMFIPSVPAIVRHAYEIEQELLHELTEEEERAERAAKEAEEFQQTLNLRMPLSASEPIFTQAIHRGLGYEPGDLTEAVAKCDQFGIPADKAVNVARLLQDERARPLEVSAQVTVQPSVTAEPQHRLEKRLRQEVEALTRRVDYKNDREPGSTNIELLKAGFPKRRDASIEKLQEMRTWLARRLA